MKCILNILIAFVLLPVVVLGSGGITNELVIGLVEKEVVSTNTIAIRETVPVRLINIGDSNPTNIVLRITDVDGTTYALTSGFAAGPTVDVDGITYNTASGTIDLNTDEFVGYYSNAPPFFTAKFVISLWDVVLNRLLVSDYISIQNNPYQPGMPGPSPINVDYIVFSSNSAPPEVSWILQYIGDGEWAAFAPTNVLTSGGSAVWGMLTGTMADQADLWAHLATLGNSNWMVGIAGDVSNGVMTALGVASNALRVTSDELRVFQDAASNKAHVAWSWGDHGAAGYLSASGDATLALSEQLFIEGPSGESYVDLNVVESGATKEAYGGFVSPSGEVNVVVGTAKNTLQSLVEFVDAGNTWAAAIGVSTNNRLYREAGRVLYRIFDEGSPIPASMIDYSATAGRIEDDLILLGTNEFSVGAGGGTELNGQPLPFSISPVDQSNWDTAYGWGDHAGAGYLKGTGTETHSGVLRFTGGESVGSILITNLWTGDGDQGIRIDGLSGSIPKHMKLGFTGGSGTPMGISGPDLEIVAGVGADVTKMTFYSNRIVTTTMDFYGWGGPLGGDYMGVSIRGTGIFMSNVVTGSSISIDPNNGLQVGGASWHSLPTGDAWQDTTNYLGIGNAYIWGPIRGGHWSTNAVTETNLYFAMRPRVGTTNGYTNVVVDTELNTVSGMVVAVASGQTIVSGMVDTVVSGQATVSGMVSAVRTDLNTVSGMVAVVASGQTVVSGMVDTVVSGHATVSGMVTAVRSDLNTVSGMVTLVIADLGTSSNALRVSISANDANLGIVSNMVSNLAVVVSSLWDTVNGGSVDAGSLGGWPAASYILLNDWQADRTNLLRYVDTFPTNSSANGELNEWSSRYVAGGTNEIAVYIPNARGSNTAGWAYWEFYEK